MERGEKLKIEYAEARVEYAEALLKLVDIKRRMAVLAVAETASESVEPIHSYGEYELEAHIERGRE